jgi:N-acetylglucosaminyldiphosphoundecaprenol N-acetyl-beta-D-mannosaminyltransferase
MASVFGIEFSPCSESELVAQMTRGTIPKGTGVRMVVTANLDHIVQLSGDPDFRAAYRHAWAATADGVPVYVYARLRGAAPPERVAGANLVKSLLPVLDPKRDRLFFVASDVATTERLARYFSNRGFPPESIDWVVPPWGFEHDGDYSEWLVNRIRERGTTHLMFGVGSPKSEIWMDRHCDRLGDCYALSVGASLEFFVATKSRAPVWMQKAGLEWSWRLAQEPRRLWRRYLIGGWRFLGAIRNDLTRRQL